MNMMNCQMLHKKQRRQPLKSRGNITQQLTGLVDKNLV
jgi:hypothetical protein